MEKWLIGSGCHWGGERGWSRDGHIRLLKWKGQFWG